MPKKLCGPVRSCGSARWPRHRKDGAPKKLCGPVRSNFVAQQGGLGTGKMVCQRSFVAQ